MQKKKVGRQAANGKMLLFEKAVTFRIFRLKYFIH